jgi:hypothetical protein
MYPVVMVHGHNNYGGFFEERRFTQPFKEQKLPYDNSITMNRNTMPTGDGSIEQHANYLVQRIPAIAAEFGSKHVNIIAHSKGGIDVREFLTKVPSNFGVITLFTISTPHSGTALADYVMDSKAGASRLLSDDSWRVNIAQQYPDRDIDRGFEQMRVGNMEDFNDRNLRVFPSSFTVDGETTPFQGFAKGADANLRDTFVLGLPIISDDYLDGVPSLGSGTRDFFFRRLVAQSVYRLLSDTERTRLIDVFSPPVNPPGLPPFYLGKGVAETPTRRYEVNDLIVTNTSAQSLTHSDTPLLPLKANHASVISPDTADGIIFNLRLFEQENIWAKR